MKGIWLAALFCWVSLDAWSQKTTIADLSCELRANPIGIDIVQPRLSWKLQNTRRNSSQLAYQIRVATDARFSKKSIVWQTERIESDQSVWLRYAGNPLQSGQRYYWQVQVWDEKNNASGWSETAFWEMGLLKRSDWKAGWIEPVQDTVPGSPALLVRKDFRVGKKVSSVKAYITSHGFYELQLNGKKAGDAVLTPGWTSYKTRLQYQVYDLTAMLRQGMNTVGVQLGDGWYRSSLGWVSNYGIWGKKLGLLCQLHIRYVDGTEEYVLSDDTWTSSNAGPIRANSIYDGEVYDARKELAGWSSPGFEAAGWQPVKAASYHLDNLIAEESVPIRKVGEIKPIRIFRTPKGTLVADMGQNMVGWVRIRLKGNAGDSIRVRHAEVLDKYGEFYTTNLRSAKATATYILKGGGVEQFEPRFTFFGFRYIALEGVREMPGKEDITGVVVHSDMQSLGQFTSSDTLINQLQHNILWGQKGNFVDVPTDCPQRDERLGWTGDAQAFIRTAAFNMNVAPFFTKWLKDLSADQQPDGKVPFVIPDVLRNNGTSAGWGDVATIAPWTLYQVYGDKGILATQYASMQAYVEYIRKQAGDSYIWKNGSVFGDWLFYKSMQQTENDGYTAPDYLATCFYAWSVQLLSKTATVLGKQSDQQNYELLFQKIKEAFNRHYVTPEGRIAGESQTAYVLALKFNLLPDHLKAAATQNLVNEIKSRGNHLSTGFLGTPYLCHVLSENGRSDVAYDLLFQTSFPSWLYPVKMGATTIWERWDGQKTDSSFQDAGMNSFNHYAYGAIGDWMYRRVAGIEIAAPGYKKIQFQPELTEKLNFAKAEFQSVYGLIRSEWQRSNNTLTVKLTIPVNTSARVRLPQAKLSDLLESGRALDPSALKAVQKESTVELELGSGEYIFQYPLPPAEKNITGN